jgi:hypothetical protein
MAATLREPAVLAAAKDRLYPETLDESGRYAVTETQFTVDTWSDWTVPMAIRERLAPYNAIRLASGEPDLLGVGMPDAAVLNGDAASRPVVAVEAKGTTTDGHVDVAGGIQQAHSHLPSVNLGYVAAPAAWVTDTDRAMARELNVGILGVVDSTSAELLEPARVTGAGDVSTDVDAIRFQAKAHRLTAGSFPVNHPKNFIGYPLALAAEAATDPLYADHVIDLPEAGRRGAILLGLVADRPDGDALTHAGAEAVRFARQHHGSVGGALEQFDDWTGKTARFTTYAPRWAQLARSVAMAYEPTQLVVEALERLEADGRSPATLPELAREAVEVDRALAIEVFLNRRSRERVLTRDGAVLEGALTDPGVFKSGIHFQFKAQLYHVGLLTSRGTDDAEAALADEWQLEESVGQAEYSGASRGR